MRAIALFAAALTLGIGSAIAADRPSYKAPPPLWTGFYVGLNAGYTWSNSNNIYTSAPGVFYAPGWDTELFASSVAASGANSTNSSGFIGGGQIGYNWQFYNSFVAGVEADIQGVAASNSSSIRGAALVPINFPNELIVSGVAARRSLDYLGTVRGRLGWLFTPTLLVYGAGGLAYGGVNTNTDIFQIWNFVDVNTPFASTGSFSDTRVGWTAGGGLEWLFWSNWSAKVEYLYYDLGSATYALSLLANVSSEGILRHVALPSSTTRFNGQIVRAGLNYHFNWGVPPAIATY